MTEAGQNTAPPIDILQNSHSNISSDTEFTDITSQSLRTTQTELSSVSRMAATTATTAYSADMDLQKKYLLHRPNIAAEMEKWYAMTDRYGFIDEDFTEPTEKQKQREVDRATKWAGMVKEKQIDGTHDFTFSNKLVKRVYKGIPDCWRRDVWYYLCTDQLQQTKRDYTLKARYATLLHQTTSNERQIDLDIPRTMHGHIMFRQRYGSGQCALFNVLRAFAGYDEEVGYCQGMANVVAMLLMYCEDEKAFLLLVHMFERDNLHDLFIPGFPALMESFYIQEKLLLCLAPSLANHLSRIGLTSDMFATRWYITLFTGGVVRYQTLLRIWDLYFLNGFDIFYCTAVALLMNQKDNLLKCDLESALAFLGGTLFVPEDQIIKLIKRLYEKTRNHNYISNFKRQYKQSISL
ncbi:rab-GTPase-TBC domain-domain-containing protein [Absidia repens]|uniref:Rab-GTPase-TBC domain-domain-containing protein n=1 Tax=Absidia repens TaxID=90262 RepID=A0A1X2J1D7_9FUNG|nr:rab-GTPase-TBC domain-domain-containing protein [Absidia repens]